MIPWPGGERFVGLQLTADDAPIVAAAVTNIEPSDSRYAPVDSVEYSALRTRARGQERAGCSSEEELPSIAGERP